MTPWKKHKILTRDGHRCRICGSEKQLRLVLLIPVPGSLQPGAMPSVLYTTVCKSHKRTLKRQNRGGMVQDSDAAFQVHCQVYHEGIYRAEQHLQFETR